MPNYDAWDPLFYSLWYQPEHINLAYTLVGKIPKDENPILSGRGSLEVFDFGCGALAMQFGLALAAADALQKGQTPLPVSITSEDTSEPMKQIGWRMWERFVDEISVEEEYPELDALRQVCREMRFDNQRGSSTIRWLAVLHVAYRENVSEVKNEIDSRVENQKPDLVLVTTHPENTSWAFSPDDLGYQGCRFDLGGESYALRGNFCKATDFRRRLYNDFKDKFSLLDSIVPAYLTYLPTAWVTRDEVKSACLLYTRR